MEFRKPITEATNLEAKLRREEQGRKLISRNLRVFTREGLPVTISREEIQARTISWETLPERSALRSDEIFIHRLTRLPDVEKAYETQGWDTTLIVQSPTHVGPTAAKPIGFPYNFPHHRVPLSRWSDQVVLRLHVDVCRYYGKIVSWPHLEPDPKYEPEKHWEMFIANNELRGPMTLDIFGLFYHESEPAGHIS